MDSHKDIVVCGKFLPPHAGHKALISHALYLAEQNPFFRNNVHVFVVRAINDYISAEARALAIYEMFAHQPEAGIGFKVHIVDDIMTDNTDHGSVYWADYTKAILGFYPRHVVGSETYIKTWAERMGSLPVLFDIDRFWYPVSGTEVRSNPYSHKEWIPYATKPLVLPRIVIHGAESTGTTTLANALAAHYNTSVVPEFGRELAEKDVDEGRAGDLSIWNDERFWLVSRGQDAMEERMSRLANGVLICDTSSLSTYVWYRSYLHRREFPISGDISNDLYRAGLEQARKHSLHILTDADIPFVQDSHGTRDDTWRGWMDNLFKTFLPHCLGSKVVVVSGTHEQRMETAIKAINRVLDI